MGTYEKHIDVKAQKKFSEISRLLKDDDEITNVNGVLKTLGKLEVMVSLGPPDPKEEFRVIRSLGDGVLCLKYVGDSPGMASQGKDYVICIIVEYGRAAVFRTERIRTGEAEA